MVLWPSGVWLISIHSSCPFVSVRLLEHLGLSDFSFCLRWRAKNLNLFPDFTFFSGVVLFVPFVFPSFLLLKLFTLCFNVALLSLVHFTLTLCRTQRPTSGTRFSHQFLGFYLSFEYFILGCRFQIKLSWLNKLFLNDLLITAAGLIVCLCQKHFILNSLAVLRAGCLLL